MKSYSSVISLIFLITIETHPQYPVQEAILSPDSVMKPSTFHD